MKTGKTRMGAFAGIVGIRRHRELDQARVPGLKFARDIGGHIVARDHPLASTRIARFGDDDARAIGVGIGVPRPSRLSFRVLGGSRLECR